MKYEIRNMTIENRPKNVSAGGMQWIMGNYITKKPQTCTQGFFRVKASRRMGASTYYEMQVSPLPGYVNPAIIDSSSQQRLNAPGRRSSE